MIIGHESKEPGEWYGVWCIHANRIMGPITDPLDEHSYLIGGQFLYPWGCDSPRCAPGELERLMMMYPMVYGRAVEPMYDLYSDSAEAS